MANSTSVINLFRHAETKKFPAGQSIFNEGDPGDIVYVVKSGLVELKAGNRVLETVGEGGLFGEMALIDNEKRSASAQAKTDCDLVVIDENRFQFLVRETPFFAVVVMRIMAHRLRNMNKLA